jgi:hypothetical protein
VLSESGLVKADSKVVPIGTAGIPSSKLALIEPSYVTTPTTKPLPAASSRLRRLRKTSDVTVAAALTSMPASARAPRSTMMSTSTPSFARGLKNV